MMVSWKEKQPLIFELLSRILSKNRLAHAYLLDGGKGLGKKDAAIWLVQAFFCEETVNGIPCEVCNNCQRIAGEIHPDVHFVEAETATIKVEQIRKLQEEFAKSSYEKGGFKAFVIFGAEKMNASSANSLLKFLEEPNDNTLAILTTENSAMLLPTILSRVQILNFQPLAKDILVSQMVENGIAKTLAQDIADLSNDFADCMEKAQDENFFELRKCVKRFFTLMTSKDAASFVYVQKSLMKHLNQKGLLDNQKKELQREVYVLLQSFCQQGMREDFSINYAKLSEEITLAQRKNKSNVSFQNTIEQLALRSLAIF